MYAVIKVGGKQYKVEQGQTLLVDRQPVEPGASFAPSVLMTGGDEVVTDGKKLEGAVTAQVVEHLRGEKLKVFTFKPKRGFKKTRGHRSELSRIQIDSIGPSKPRRAPAKKAADEKPAEKAAAAPAKKPAAKKPAARKPAAAKKPAAPKKPATRRTAAAGADDTPKPARRTRAPKPKEDTGDGA
jgi:large subunit ribosomal protein L21